MKLTLNEDAATLWEAGHYYTSKGPTEWSAIGWKIMQEIKKNRGDSSMLFIDDIHPIETLHPDEQTAPLIDFNPDPTFIVLESAMKRLALDVLQELKGLSKRKKAKQSKKSGSWFLSTFPLTDPEGRPLCVLLDAALSVYKNQLGFEQTVNLLPSHYYGQQANLKKILSRILPEFNLQTLFFNLESGLIQSETVTVPFKNPNL